jgi:hypothetical protein
VKSAFVLLFAALAVGCRQEAPRKPPEPAPKPVEAPPAAPPPAAAPAPVAAEPSVADEELVGEAPEADPTSETVTIKLVADPQRKAQVFWGRKNLGLAPLELQRPRGSGPLDLVVIAPGALPLHTRVFTDRDDKLSLRLYSEAEAPNLLGYRPPEAVPPPAKGNASDAARPKKAWPSR